MLINMQMLQLNSSDYKVPGENACRSIADTDTDTAAAADTDTFDLDFYVATARATTFG